MEKISVAELQKKLADKQNVFILDVRPSDQRKEWKIGDSVHVDAYQKLNDGDDTALDMVEVPEGSTVVTVCAAGRTSLLASTLLHRKGVKSLSLEGGMKAWNYAWNTAELQFEGVKIIQVRRAAKGVLSYIIGSNGEAVVIDAALDPDTYLSIARQNGWEIKFVMDTHIHADYVSRTKDLAKASGAKLLLNENSKVAFDFLSVKDGDEIHFGSTALKVIHTPGHTWESTTFRLGDMAIFSGDTLFTDSVGRPDLNADRVEGIEKAKALYRSVKMLTSLHSDIMVLPAHTSNTVSFDNKLIADTISNVAARIDFAQMSESDFIEYTTSRIPPPPPNYEVIAAINKQGSYEGHVLADLEAGGNHCAISASIR
jgi:glyoxylase-like metal-dependent hydrolase (beta-lactamase superfamily II)